MRHIDVGQMSRRILTLTATLVCTLLGGCASGPPATFDLVSPDRTGALKPLDISLVVAEPSASRALETEQMIVRDQAGAVYYLPGAQWADRISVLVETRFVRAIEALGFSVSREGNGVTADRVVTSEITAFDIIPGAEPVAHIAIIVRLINTHEGRILGSKSFVADETFHEMTGADAASAFETALNRIAPDIAKFSVNAR
jgi:cholesterol transport system auxiliary component